MSVERYFPEAIDHPETLSRLESLANSLAESADDSFAKWETFAIKNNSPKVTDSRSLDAFQASLEKQVRTSSVKRPKLMPRQVLGPQKFTGLKLEADSAGSKQYEVTGFSPETQSVEHKKSAPPHFRLNTDLNEFAKNRPFNESAREISVALDQQIEAILNAVMDRFGWPLQNFSNPHNISQNQVTVIGRICREQAAAKTMEEAEADWQSKPLGRKSVLIETSRRIGAGSRTVLDLDIVSDDDFAQSFEGQIVVLKGKNPKGQMFIVDEIVDLPALKVAQVPSPSTDNDRISRICVSNAASTYENLESVLNWIMAAYAQQIIRDIPSALIVLGPLATIGSTNDSSRETQRIADMLTRFRAITANNVPVFLIPHADDIATSDPSFPQQSYLSSLSNLDQPTVALSNPCTFSIDEIALTVSSAHTLVDMKLDSGLESKFRHVLRQRQIYPVYPPALSTNVSQPLLKSSRLEIAPNVLILPHNGPTQSLIVDGVSCSASGQNSITVSATLKDERPLVERIVVDSLQVNEI